MCNNHRNIPFSEVRTLGGKNPLPGLGFAIPDHRALSRPNGGRVHVARPAPKTPVLNKVNEVAEKSEVPTAKEITAVSDGVNSKNSEFDFCN